MKKKYFLSVFLMLLITQTVYSSLRLNNKNICIKKEDSCSKEHSFDCGSTHCSFNYSQCLDFQHLTAMTNSLKSNEIQKMMVKKYQYLIASIKPCKTSELKYSGICIRRKECFKRTRVPLRTGLSFYQKKVKCLCENKKMEYLCGDFCTPNKRICDQFKMKLANRTSLVLSQC